MTVRHNDLYQLRNRYKAAYWRLVATDRSKANRLFDTFGHWERQRDHATLTLAVTAFETALRPKETA